MRARAAARGAGRRRLAAVCAHAVAAFAAAADARRASRATAATQTLALQLTSEADPFFLHALEVSEDDFQALKARTRRRAPKRRSTAPRARPDPHAPADAPGVRHAGGAVHPG